MLTSELYGLSLAAAGILSILFILLFYLLVRKAFSIRQRNQIEIEKKQYEEPIFTFLDDGQLKRKLTPSTFTQKKAVEELLAKFAGLLEGEKEKKRIFELAQIHLTDFYRIRLKSRKWSDRMNALFHIEDFRIRTLEGDIISLFEKKKLTRDEAIHVLRILAAFQSKEIYSLLLEHFNSLSTYEYRNILTRLDENRFDQIVLGFHKCGIPLQSAILDVMGTERKLKYVSFIESVFRVYSGEIKIRALKTLGEIGYVKDIDLYLPLCESASWEERMMAAKLIGVLRERKGIPDLKGLLHDSNWWVRSQAGQSIKSFSDGEQVLQSILETSSDTFARDMAWEWLHKGD